MTHSKQEKTQQFWSYTRLGCPEKTLAVLSQDLRVDPFRPPYQVVSVAQIPTNVEMELLVVRLNRSWMKIRAFVEDSNISYLCYRELRYCEMPDGLAAIRLQSLDSGMIYPPVYETLNAFSGQFSRIYKLPELSVWEKEQARKWLEEQSTPGTAVNYCHELALYNNEVAKSIIPLWLRRGPCSPPTPPVSMESIHEMANESKHNRRPIPNTRKTDLIVLRPEESEEAKEQPSGNWLTRIFGHSDRDADQ